MPEDKSEDGENRVTIEQETADSEVEESRSKIEDESEDKDDDNNSVWRDKSLRRWIREASALVAISGVVVGGGWKAFTYFAEQKKEDRAQEKTRWDHEQEIERQKSQQEQSKALQLQAQVDLQKTQNALQISLESSKVQEAQIDEQLTEDRLKDQQQQREAENERLRLVKEEQDSKRAHALAQFQHEKEQADRESHAADAAQLLKETQEATKLIEKLRQDGDDAEADLTALIDRLAVIEKVADSDNSLDQLVRFAVIRRASLFQSLSEGQLLIRLMNALDTDDRADVAVGLNRAVLHRIYDALFIAIRTYKSPPVDSRASKKNPQTSPDIPSFSAYTCTSAGEVFLNTYVGAEIHPFDWNRVCASITRQHLDPSDDKRPEYGIVGVQPAHEPKATSPEEVGALIAVARASAISIYKYLEDQAQLYTGEFPVQQQTTDEQLDLILGQHGVLPIDISNCYVPGLKVTKLTADRGLYKGKVYLEFVDAVMADE